MTRRAKKPSLSQSQRKDQARAFRDACRLWDDGHLVRAFHALVDLAGLGDAGAMVNVGYFFDQGLGVKKNWVEARRWYRRAYVAGSSSGANNIAIHYRNQRNARLAIRWFHRAVQLGDDGGLLQLAKMAMRTGRQHDRLVRGYLNKVVRSCRVTECEREEAAELLGRLRTPGPRARRKAPSC